MRYRDIPPYGLRLQPALKEKLDSIVAEKKSKKPDWSLNSEISERLENSLTPRTGLEDFTDGELIDECIRRWGKESVRVVVTVEKKDAV